MDMDRNETGATRINPVEARQAVTGHNVIRVLTMGVGLAVVAGIILYFTVGV
ncbi:hypothetical protein [uncultured Alsobacter sp.]|uniref:hypothetical protein n=1 Tax=uncultured Alsobacter sp. TaxID=1748258 RepID=UPI0025D35D8D|nr:hypothetical protein [uncultured Alsobacter sp.]